MCKEEVLKFKPGDLVYERYRLPEFTRRGIILRRHGNWGFIVQWFTSAPGGFYKNSNDLARLEVESD